MGRLESKKQLGTARARRVRNVVRGTADRPRLSVYVSNQAISAQVINDLEGKTLVGARSKDGVNVKAAEKFGTEFAKMAKKAKVKQVVLDRGSKRYHGRIKAFADAARKEGLDF